MVIFYYQRDNNIVPNAALIDSSKYWKKGLVYFSFSNKKIHSENSKKLIREIIV